MRNSSVDGSTQCRSSHEQHGLPRASARSEANKSVQSFLPLPLVFRVSGA